MDKVLKRLLPFFGIGIVFVLLIAIVIIFGDPTEKTTTTEDVGMNGETEVISSTASTETTQPTTENEWMDDPSVAQLTIWDIDWHLFDMIQKYRDTHPQFDYEINSFTYQCTYDPPPGLEWVRDKLMNGTEDVPDIICIDTYNAREFIDGELSEYMASFDELGFDLEALIASNEIPEYMVNMGVNEEGELKALPYESNTGAFFYRRSIAKDVWGTDDPEFVGNKIGPGWEKFLAAAGELRAKGYGIVSGPSDIWMPFINSAQQGWVVDGKLNLNPEREAFLDLTKELYEGDYTNMTKQWDFSWLENLEGAGEKQTFGYFSSYNLESIIKDQADSSQPGEGSYGDWAVCMPTDGFVDYGYVIMVNKNTKLKQTVADILKWLTLDSSENGMQYFMANGEYNEVKTPVPSGVLMREMDGSNDFFSGQNVFEVFAKANQLVNGKNSNEYDYAMQYYYQNQVYEYAMGNKTREQAIEDFKNTIRENEMIDVIVE